jgi:hypothetical protein
MANGGQVDHRPTGRVLYAASNNGPPTGTGVANPVGDESLLFIAEARLRFDQ